MIGRSGGTPWSRWSDAGHLSLDAMVAFVDGELGEAAAGRAAAHVDHCPACAVEAAAQRQARRRLRAADTPCAPSSLMNSLRSIPDSAELPEAPAGLAVDAQGRFVVPAEAPPARRGRGRRAGGPRSRRRVVPAVVASGLVAGAAVVAGPVLAAGAVPTAVAPERAPGAAASLTAAVPVAGDRGNPVAGAVAQDAVDRRTGSGTSTATTSATPPPDATRARPSS
ncbi:zf-HC2 domain-containing protein [Actinomycetospora termitidis]|uniref:Zf-HC2 domain-containing protein n=1 Tax=Actinomycetospora termitidis TaxID=3053470 RepID=A0ABT7M9J6_9PSEU|nr:zf-HC2 domain-containing protein [Actinomycetospora sp. Odt1-22]MDL5157341.1 zf-HC2 domain-containing protein [Actinomycetospora sp. Odt1-22]